MKIPLKRKREPEMSAEDEARYAGYAAYRPPALYHKYFKENTKELNLQLLRETPDDHDAFFEMLDEILVHGNWIPYGYGNLVCLSVSDIYEGDRNLWISRLTVQTTYRWEQWRMGPQCSWKIPVNEATNGYECGWWSCPSTFLEDMQTFLDPEWKHAELIPDEMRIEILGRIEELRPRREEKQREEAKMRELIAAWEAEDAAEKAGKQ